MVIKDELVLDISDAMEKVDRLEAKIDRILEKMESLSSMSTIIYNPSSGLRYEEE